MKGRWRSTKKGLVWAPSEVCSQPNWFWVNVLVSSCPTFSISHYSWQQPGMERVASVCLVYAQVTPACAAFCHALSSLGQLRMSLLTAGRLELDGHYRSLLTQIILLFCGTHLHCCTSSDMASSMQLISLLHWQLFLHKDYKVSFPSKTNSIVL